MWIFFYFLTLTLPGILSVLSRPPVFPSAGEIAGASAAAEEAAGGGGGGELSHQRPAAEAAAGAGGDRGQQPDHEQGDHGPAQPAQVVLTGRRQSPHGWAASPLTPLSITAGSDFSSLILGVYVCVPVVSLVTVIFGNGPLSGFEHYMHVYECVTHSGRATFGGLYYENGPCFFKHQFEAMSITDMAGGEWWINKSIIHYAF